MKPPSRNRENARGANISLEAALARKWAAAVSLFDAYAEKCLNSECAAKTIDKRAGLAAVRKALLTNPGREEFSRFFAGFEIADGFDEFSEKFGEKFSAFKSLFINGAVKPGLEELRRLSAREELRGARGAAASAKALAKGLAAAFAGAGAYYAENAEKLADSENIEIINGINETLRIKAESLNENLEIFSAEATLMLESRESPQNEPDGEIAEECLADLLDELVLLDREGGRAALPLFRRFSGGRAIARKREKLCRRVPPRFAPLKKLTFAFIKDSVLFELVTFEEILRYSVCRVKESENPADADYAAFVENIAAEVREILRRSGIEIIEPKPRDAFNGKEHEVLAAERDERFKKGEIIKVLNAGYKRGETVYIRANVIACC